MFNIICYCVRVATRQSGDNENEEDKDDDDDDDVFKR